MIEAVERTTTNDEGAEYLRDTVPQPSLNGGRPLTQREVAAWLEKPSHGYLNRWDGLWRHDPKRDISPR